MAHNNLAPKLRSWITELTLPLRGMQVEAKDLPSYFGAFMAANQTNATILTYDDRRYHIPPRQEVELHEVLNMSTTAFRRTLLAESTLMAFASLLARWEVDEEKVLFPADTEAKRAMQQASIDSPDQVVRALRMGDFAYFVMMLPPLDDIVEASVQLTAYRDLMARIYTDLIEHPYGTDVTIPLSRSDLRTIFFYLIGWKSSPGKLFSSLTRFGLEYHQEIVPYRGATMPGMPFTFRLTEQADLFYQTVSQSAKDVQRTRMKSITGGKS